MKGLDRVIAGLAEAQFGAFSRKQAAEIGFSEYAMTRRAASGAWEELFPSVYRIPGSPRTGRQRAMAATLWAGPHSAISHTTAARLLRLDGVQANGLHLTIRRTSGLRTDNASLHRVDQLPRIDRVTVDGIPCTTATRSIIDAAAQLDDEPLEVAYESARRMGLTSPDALATRATELCRRGRPGSSRIRRLLGHQRCGEPALQYRLEVKLARLLRASALPPFARQYPVGRYRIDFALPDLRVGIECDGFESHGYRLAWKRDRRRVAEIEVLGWHLVFVTWDDVTKHPDQTLDRIRLALRPV